MSVELSRLFYEDYDLDESLCSFRSHSVLFLFIFSKMLRN